MRREKRERHKTKVTSRLMVDPLTPRPWGHFIPDTFILCLRLFSSPEIIIKFLNTKYFSNPLFFSVKVFLCVVLELRFMYWMRNILGQWIIPPCSLSRKTEHHFFFSDAGSAYFNYRTVHLLAANMSGLINCTLSITAYIITDGIWRGTFWMPRVGIKLGTSAKFQYMKHVLYEVKCCFSQKSLVALWRAWLVIIASVSCRKGRSDSKVKQWKQSKYSLHIHWFFLGGYDVFLLLPHSQQYIA